MRTIGEELISSDSVAIIELVKNSYDADAQNVVIRFHAPVEKGMGSIEVIDDGNGMSIETVQTAWLELATPTKSVRKRSLNLGRRVLGEKGIGRFAAARLSAESEVFSRQRNQADQAYVYVDWTQFDDDEKFLDEVEVLSESQARTNSSLNSLFLSQDNGTILRLNKLKSDWNDSSFTQLQQALSRLISPFASIDNFHIRVEAPDGFERFTSTISAPDVVNHPHYRLRGKVNGNGEYDIECFVTSTGDVSKHKGKFQLSSSGWQMIDSDGERFVEGMRIPDCGPIDVELRIWDRDDLGGIIQAAQSTLRDVRRDLDSHAGINIYRDGFRVLPYGEPRNDWLRLDLRRVQNPSLRLSNNQILGYIALTSDGNPNLKDQSNREGLRENQALQDLSDIMINLISRIEVTRRKSRRGDRKAGNPNDPDKQQGIFTPPDFSKLNEYLNSSRPEDKIAQALLGEVEQGMAKQLDVIKTTVSRYQGLVTLGQLVDTVLHNGRQPLSKIAAEALLAKEDLEEISGFSTSPVLKQIHTRTVKISAQAEVLHGVFKRVEPFGGRKRGRPTKITLESVVRTSFEIFSADINKHHIQVHAPSTETWVTVDPAELQEVFVNLIQNSIYWLSTVPAKSRAISTFVERTIEGAVEIIFSDTGPGVSENMREDIFEPYFSTRSDGTGLGLSVSGEIIRDYYEGALELIDDGRETGATFKITLRKRV
nr:ATP-binding protein [Herbaspirillum sp. LeCh32-8]